MASVDINDFEMNSKRSTSETDEEKVTIEVVENVALEVEHAENGSTANTTLEEFYQVLKDYLEVSILGKIDDPNLTEAFCRRNYYKLINLIDVADSEDEGRSLLETFCDALIMLNEKYPKNKKDVRNILLSTESLKLFRKNSFSKNYSCLVRINDVFSVSDIRDISISPEIYFYGKYKEINKGYELINPIDNDGIKSIVDVFINNQNFEKVGEWIFTIISFDEMRLPDGTSEEFIKKRNDLKKQFYKKILSDGIYKDAIVEYLFGKKIINKLIDSYVEHPYLKTINESLTTELEERLLSDRDQRANLKKRLDEREAQLAEYQKKEESFEKCRKLLDEITLRYNDQQEKYETELCENRQAIELLENERMIIKEENESLKVLLDDVKSKYEALDADLSLRNNEFERIKDISSQKDKTAKVELLQELVTGINEQLYYLTMFYLELKDTGRLLPESIELYLDTLNNIDNVFSGIGIEKIGIIDKEVQYDASLYFSTDSRISNGEKVIVCGYGWKIGDEVFIKAPVERGEQ